MHQRIMGASQNSRLWMRHFAVQRVHMTLHQSLGKNEIPVFNGVYHAAAGLCLHIHPNGPKGQFALKGAA